MQICTAYDSITFNQPDSMWISSAITDVSCNNFSNGSIDLVNIEGIAPFIFSIDQFASQQNNEIFTNLSVGNYIIEVIDSLGCETSIDIFIDNANTFIVTTDNPITMPIQLIVMVFVMGMLFFSIMVQMVCQIHHGSILVVVNGIMSRNIQRNIHRH